MFSDEQCEGDTDGDVIPDYFESHAFDPTFTSDGFLLYLERLGAHPERKDIFVEIDCLVSDGNGNGVYTDSVDHSHCPLQDSIQLVVQAFADAPVTNPDGTTGVQLHVDVGGLYGAGFINLVEGAGGVTGHYGDLRGMFNGEIVGGGDKIEESGNEIIDWDGSVGDPATSFYDLKSDHFNTEKRQAVFHYAIFGHQSNSNRPLNDCTGGWSEQPGNDFMVTLGGVRTDGTTACYRTDANGFSIGSVNQQAGNFMHELGHNLGLNHGGQDGVNYKPNYFSVMHYLFSWCDVPVSPAGTIPGGCDYSRVACPTLNETSLDECLGVNCGMGFGPNNWNGMNGFEGNTCPPPNDSNISWDINLDGWCVGPGDDGFIDPTTIVDTNDQLDTFHQRILDAADRCCDSAANGDDYQIKEIGECQQPDELVGFEDWNSLIYAFQTTDTYEDGNPGFTPIDATPEMIQEARKYVSDQWKPQLVVEKSISTNTLPNKEMHYTINLKNTGRGPALKVVIKDTLFNGSTREIRLPSIVAGSEAINTIVFQPPSTHQFCDALNNTVEVRYEDIVGYEKVITHNLEPKYEYAVKLICGVQEDPVDLQLARGFYTTIANIHNPNRSSITLCKKLALAFPPGKQMPGKVIPLAMDTLGPDEALAVDCVDIKNRAFPEGYPTSYIDGVLVIQSTESVDVEGVYSTASLNGIGEPLTHSSIEINHVKERSISVEKRADLIVKKNVNTLRSLQLNETTILKEMQYVVLVKNMGPDTAVNVSISDEMELRGGVLNVTDQQDYEVTHGGSWEMESATQTSAKLRGKIPTLNVSETAVLKFTVGVATPSDKKHQAELRNKVTVYSDSKDPVLGNNTHTLVTETP